jgi:hypothetical protein
MIGTYNPITIRTSESVKEVVLRSSEVILPLNTTAGTVQRQMQPAPSVKPAAPKKDDEPQ